MEAIKLCDGENKETVTFTSTLIPSQFEWYRMIFTRISSWEKYLLKPPIKPLQCGSNWSRYIFRPIKARLPIKSFPNNLIIVRKREIFSSPRRKCNNDIFGVFRCCNFARSDAQHFNANKRSFVWAEEAHNRFSMRQLTIEYYARIQCFITH